MKITDIAQATAAQPKAGASAQPASDKPPADKVRAKGPDRMAQAISVAQAAAEPSRAARIAQLKTLVHAGQYAPDAQRIADQIMNAAQIDAALRSMLQ